MTPRLSGYFSIFGLVFFVLKSFLGIARQWTRGKFAIFCLAIPRKDLSTKKTKTNIEKMTSKPQGHVRILIYIERGQLVFSTNCILN